MQHGRVMHICIGKLTIIGSDNGLSPERRQAIIWTNAGILLIGPLGTNFSEILIEIQTFSLKKIHLKMSSANCCSFRLGLNVLRSGEIPTGTRSLFVINSSEWQDSIPLYFWNISFIVARIHISSDEFTHFGTKYEMMPRFNLWLKRCIVSYFVPKHTNLLLSIYHYTVPTPLVSITHLFRKNILYSKS